MKKTLSILAFLAIAAAVQAAPVLTLAVNTASLSGTTGSLDFQFNPGALTSQSATVQISNIMGGTFEPSAQTIGGVTGMLPASAAITNSGQLNDLFQPFLFGNTLTFNLAFSGPAVSSPNGTALSGSTFGFSIFTDAAGATPAFNSTGLLASVQVNTNGSVTPSSLNANAQFVPEPASLSLLGLGLAGLALLRKSRRS